MSGKTLMFLIILISLSCISCIHAADLDNSTYNLTQADAQNLEVQQNSNDNGMIAKSNGTDILSVEPQSSEISSSGSDSATNLILDNDEDKENIYIGDYVTWIISVANSGPNKAKNVKVFNKLPDGLKYVKHTASKGAFNPKTGIWSIGDISNGNEVFLYITTLAVSVGEKVNKANLTSDTVNLNNETYEEEEIDVFTKNNENPTKHHAGHSIRTVGNPIGLVLISLLGCFIGYFKK